ncbi:hypothetical protein BA894_11515 [Vibrio natriegens]|uniref:trypsin-like serine protease n=1 Tax=Vibrio natriegens TaxID=691 RepID=UPI0008046865|nr:trypsin-like serine protease [Vibrio natriegens]ANQ27042.1 hypothetical protein BA894_11515 [Vibrio natriegens]
MKKTQINVPLALLFTMTPSVYAVENGTAVTEEEYSSHNYIVQMHDVVSNANCGAQLVASNWLLTARHCTPFYSGNTSFDEDPQYQGEEMDLKIYQGVEGNNLDSNLVYDDVGYVYSIGGESEADVLLSEHAEKFTNLVQYIDCDNGTTCDSSNNVFISSDGMLSDVVLIKLNNDIAYQTTAKFKYSQTFPEINARTDLIDYLSNGAELYQLDDELVFRGFGTDELSQDPDTMMKGTLSAQSYTVSMTCYTEQGVCTSENLQADDFSWLYLDVRQSGSLFFNEADSDVNPGDSGTAITTTDNYVIGLTSRDDSDGGIFVGVDGLLPWIQSTVEGLNAPKHVKFASGSIEHELEVQNLSTSTIAIAPYVALGDAQLSSDCPQTLVPLEVCTVTVLGELTEESSFTIALNSSHEVVYEADIDESDTDDSTDETDSNDGESTENASSGGGSGGSLGLITVLALGLISRRNSMRKK